MIEKFRKNLISPNDMKQVKGGIAPMVWDCVKENGGRVIVNGSNEASMSAWIDDYNATHTVDIVGCTIQGQD